MVFEYLNENSDPSQGRLCKQIHGSKATQVISEFLSKREQIIGSAFSKPEEMRLPVAQFGLILGDTTAIEAYVKEGTANVTTPYWIVSWSNEHEKFDRVIYQLQPDGEFHYVVLSERHRDIDYTDARHHVDREKALPIIAAFKKEARGIEQSVLASPGEATEVTSYVEGMEELGLGVWHAVYSRPQGRFLRLQRMQGFVYPVIDLDDYEAEMKG
jgi:hypothetical protein